jgi:hypothetical protein
LSSFSSPAVLVLSWFLSEVKREEEEAEKKAQGIDY